jgi:hypothetical protein
MESMMPDLPAFLADPFHNAALFAFVDAAKEAQGWPESEAVRKRAYAYYENREKDMESMETRIIRLYGWGSAAHEAYLNQQALEEHYKIGAEAFGASLATAGTPAPAPVAPGSRQSSPPSQTAGEA